MSSTLIVRDALLVVHGDPTVPEDPEKHLASRVKEARSFGRRVVEDCLSVLAPSAGGDDCDPEVLEAVLILALAHPKLAADHALEPVVVGRRLAASLEKSGDTGTAHRSLLALAEFLPGNRAIERDLAGLMRREGMVQDLVERYLDRAKRLLDEGKKQEAIPCLREVLQLDRSRKDVARMIRDLRFDEVDEIKKRRRRVRVAVLVVLLSLGASLVGLREVQVSRDYRKLPPGEEGDLVSLRARLSALEGFVDEYPVWHGSLGVLQERSALRVEIDRLNEETLTRREMSAAKTRRQQKQADGARVKARNLAEARDFEGALAEFRRALELAAYDWEHRARTERDIAAIEEFLAEGGK